METPQGGAGRAVVDLAALLTRVDGAIGRALPGVEEVTGEVGEPHVTGGWARCTLLQPLGDDLAVLPLYLPPDRLRRIRREVAPRTLEGLLAPGQTVTVAERVRRSSRTGKVELRVERVDAATGEGLLARRRCEAEARLRAEGLLDRQRALLRLPLAPLRVALVSGWDSDGLSDARRVMDDSGYQVACTTYQERLEGPQAATRIARALALAAGGGSQVVLLVRGGGPGTALSPFDAEPVARAIAAAEVPVLTGIGHQRHHTLADAVAHRACITPTGAAESVVRRLRQAEAQLEAAAAHAREAAGSARRARQGRWQQVRLSALAAVALGVAALLVGDWPLLLAAAAAALAAARAVPRGRSGGPEHGGAQGERRGGAGARGRSESVRDAALPADVEGVITELDGLAAGLGAATGSAAVAVASARVHQLHLHGRRLLRGPSPHRLGRHRPGQKEARRTRPRQQLAPPP